MNAATPDAEPATAQSDTAAASVKPETALPWDYECVGADSAGPDANDVYEIITKDRHRRVAEHVWGRDARYIVGACNAHPHLVAALQQALLQIEYMQSKFTTTGTGNAVIAQINALLSKLWKSA